MFTYIMNIANFTFIIYNYTYHMGQCNVYVYNTYMSQIVNILVYYGRLCKGEEQRYI